MAKKPRVVEPFKNLEDIERIKKYLKDQENLRDYTIFVVGINVGLGAGDLLTFKWGDILDEDVKVKSKIHLKNEKTSKDKSIELNSASQDALEDFKYTHDSLVLDDYVFASRKGNSHLQVRSLHRIINDLVKVLGIKGNYGTRSLRKTFGYHRYMNNVKVETLQEIFNHNTETMTLKYIGVTKDDIKHAYKSVNL